MISSRSRFYSYTGTLPSDAPSYIPRQADQDLLEGLQRGEFCYVLTSRQQGKSSLMLRTATRLLEEGVAVAVIDLTRIGNTLDVEQWYSGLLSSIGASLDLEDELQAFWEANAGTGPLLRWMKALREVVLTQRAGRIVVFIDEIDYVRTLPFSTDEFFAAIRACYNLRTEDAAYHRLTFCLLGVAMPSDLIRDVRTTPFNIGRRIEPTDFTAAEAAKLAEGLKRPERLSVLLLERMLYWTGGHPYLTQRLCQALAEDPDIADTAGVDRLCAELFLSPSARRQNDNLLFVRDYLLRNREDPAALLTLYAQILRGKPVPNEESNPLIDILRLSGIVCVADGKLQVRNRIYAYVFDRAWITESMPGAELRRQRAAFRAGALRAASLAMIVLAVVTSLAVLAIRERKRTQIALHEVEAEKSKLQRVEKREAAELVEQKRLNRALRLQTLRADKNEKEKAKKAKQVQEEKGKAEVAAAREHRAKVLEEENAFFTDMDRAHQEIEEGNDQKAQFLLAAAQGSYRNVQSPAAAQSAPSFGWRYLQSLCALGPRRTLYGHTDRIQILAFSPSAAAGNRYLLASAGTDNTVRFWNAQTGVPWDTPLRYNGTVYGLAFSPEGNLLAIAGEDNTVAFYDMQRKRFVGAPFPAHSDTIDSVDISADGKRFATSSSDRTVRVWEMGTKRRLREFKTQNSAYVVAFSPDGRLLAATGAGGYIYLWDLTTGRKLASLKDKSTNYDVKFSPSGNLLATGGDEGVVKLWNVKAGAHIFAHYRELPVGNMIRSLAFGPQKTALLAVGIGAGKVEVWNLASASAKPVCELKTGTGRYVQTTFSHDGKLLAATDGDQNITLWNVDQFRTLAASAEPLRTQYPAYVYSVAVSHDGTTLAAASAEGIVRLWDRKTHRLKRALYFGAPLRTVLFSEKDRYLAASAANGTIILWEAATGKTWMLRGHAGPISSLAFSPDGRYLASASSYGEAFAGDVTNQIFPTEKYDGEVRIWSLQPQNFGHVDRIHLSPAGRYALAIAFTADSRGLIEGCTDGRVRIFSLNTNRLEDLTGSHGTDSVYSLAVSPDGRFVATGSPDHTWALWDVQAKRMIAQSTEKNDHTVRTVCFSPNGAKVALGLQDYTVRVCDLSRHPEIMVPGQKVNAAPLGDIVCRHQDWVLSVAFCADNQTVVSGGRDQAVRLSDADTGRTTAVFDLSLHAVAVSPNGRTIARAYGDRSILLWNIDRGNSLRVLYSREVASCLAFSRDGSLLAAGAATGNVELWETASGRNLGRIRRGHRPVRSLAFGSDDRTLAVGEEQAILLWNPHNGQTEATWKLPAELSCRLAVAPNGRLLAAADKDSWVSVYDLTRRIPVWRQRLKQTAGSCLAFSSDSWLLAVGTSKGDIERRSAVTGKLLGVALPAHDGPVTAMAFSDSTLATGGEDKSIKLWNLGLSTPEDVLTLTEHHAPVTTLAFSADGNLLFSSSDDVPVCIHRTVQQAP